MAPRLWPHPKAVATQSSHTTTSTEGTLPSRSALFDAPRRAVVVQQVEEGLRGKRFGTEHTSTGPDARGHQLQGNARVDRGLPDDRLCAVLLHRPFVVDDVVEVHLARLSIDAGSLHPRAGARAAAHAIPQRRRVGEA